MLKQFKNRNDAGDKLSLSLNSYKNNKEVVVYGLPRGGMSVAKRVSAKLNLPIEALIVKKIGHPVDPEFAIGAISEDYDVTGDDEELNNVDQTWLNAEKNRLITEINERKYNYRRNRQFKDPKSKIAILVDDGVATGHTLFSAIRYLKKHQAKKIIVAVPVIPGNIVDQIRDEVDELEALITAEDFNGSVGSYYQSFPQVSDEEVIKLIADPIIFSMPLYSYLVDDLTDMPGITAGRYQIECKIGFGDRLSVFNNVAGDKCLIFTTINPPADNIVETFLLADTLKKEGAKHITWVAPYLSYMVQSLDQPGMSLGAKWIAKIAEASGIDDIVTVDLHNRLVSAYFQIPIVSLSPAKIFSEQLDQDKLENTVLVALTEESIKRCQDLNNALGKNLSIAYFEKEEHEEIVRKLVGELMPNVIIMDDIINTGVRCLSACEVLVDKGVSDIIIMASHGLFSNPLWEDLWNYNVSDIYVTDSLPQKKSVKAKGVCVLPIAPLLKEYIEKNV